MHIELFDRKCDPIYNFNAEYKSVDYIYRLSKDIVVIILINEIIIQSFLVFCTESNLNNCLLIFKKIKKFIIKYLNSYLFKITESTYRCRNCNMKNKFNCTNDFSSNTIFQCEYCFTYDKYDKSEILTKENTSNKNLKKITKYKYIKSSEIIEEGIFKTMKIYL